MSCSMDCDVINRIFRICNLTRVSLSRVILTDLLQTKEVVILMGPNSIQTIGREELISTHMIQARVTDRLMS